jgi:uncharacterized protein YcfL
MKKVLAAVCIISLFIIACSKREAANTNEIQALQPHYDTTAIDSFSAGAEFRRDERVMRFLTVSLDKHAISWAERRRAKLKSTKA